MTYLTILHCRYNVEMLARVHEIGAYTIRR